MIKMRTTRLVINNEKDSDNKTEGPEELQYDLLELE